DQAGVPARGPARGADGPAALGPGAVLPRCRARAGPRPARPPWRGVRARRPGDLAGPAGGDRDRDHPVRDGGGQRVGPPAAPPGPPGRVGAPRGRAADPGGDLDPPGRRSPAGDRNPKPVWLWWSRASAGPADVDRGWQAWGRVDIEDTFRPFKQTLGWTAPKIRDPQAADRRAWIVTAAHAQLRPARPLAPDLRRPWERPARP